MTRDYVKWRSHQLQRDMELVVFGDAGAPLIVFPTSMGAFFEYEDRGMIAALADKINAGALQVFCISTIDKDSFYADEIHPRQRIERYLAWERYLLEDVVPFVRHRNGAQTMAVTGCSFGAYHAFVMALRHPDIFTSLVTMGGAFDLKRFLDGYHDSDAYLLSPPDFLPQLNDLWFLDRMRANKWVLVTGENDICRRQTEEAAAMLAAKGVPHSLHVWGHGSHHDWPEWVKMAKAYLPEVLFAMRKIGVLFGMEESFPPALVEYINRMGVPNVSAEAVIVGAVKMDEAQRYRVIVDRISHDVPFYRAFLKNAILTGTTVINNPFWWSADDKFFNYALATRLGVAIPPTVILPHKDHPPSTTAKSMRNLQYPLNWDEVFAYIGFPAFLKPFDGGGWRDVFKVTNPAEFFDAYNQSKQLCMTLQRGVNFREYFRCYVIGQEHVHVMPYDPGAPQHERYVKHPPAYDPALIARVRKDALTLCRALGYDLNTVEFAVENGIPYAIDFMNPAPDAERASVGDENFTWIVKHVAELAVKKALEPAAPPTYRWDGLLAGR